MFKKYNYLFEEDDLENDDVDLNVSDNEEKSEEEEVPEFPTFKLRKNIKDYNKDNVTQLISDIKNSYNDFMNKYKKSDVYGVVAGNLEKEWFSDSGLGNNVWKGNLKNINDWYTFWYYDVLKIDNNDKNKKPDLKKFVKLWNKFWENFINYANKVGIWVNTHEYTKNAETHRERKSSAEPV